VAESRIIVGGALMGACLLLLVNLAGCSSSTDPGVDPPDPPPTIEFVPGGREQTLRLSRTMRFSIVARPAASLSAKWYRQGLLVGEDSFFRFVPAAVGREVLKVSAFVGAERDTYYWVIDVVQDVSVIPPEVPNVLALPGPEPADVIVSWGWVTDAAFPLIDYTVAVSYDGPINAENWNESEILGSYTRVPGQVGDSRTYTETDHGMRPGERAWFAVRVRDDRQQLSPLTSNAVHDITWPWFLGGHVTDDVGLPLLGVIINSDGPGHSTNTDGSGYYLFDQPFRNIDSIRIATASPSWYDFVTPSISVDQVTTVENITLINQYELGYDCWGGEFLEYLRDMTRTQWVDGQPEHSLLYSWSEYPISVFIPPFFNQAGIDMEAACLAAMDFWNNVMSDDALQLGISETDYFVRTANESTADIVFLFEWRIQNYGAVSLLLPSGPDAHLGRVIPEKMQIWINTDVALDLFVEVQGVTLHEFGHTLGLLAHSECFGSEYLMSIIGGTGAMGRDNPVHLDERRAVRAIRNIPQAADMGDYSLGRIQF